MKTFSRLQKIDRALKKCSPQGATIRTLQRESNLPRATVYKTLKELKEMGAPLITPRSGFHAYAAGAAFELPGFAWLSEGEIGTLIGLMSWLGKPESEALEEIVGPFRRRIEIMASRLKISADKLQSCIELLPMHARNIRPGLLRQICDGLLRERKLRIHYFSHGKEHDREVSPQKLVRYRDNWYLDAWCHMRDDLRIFSLSRIRRVEPLSEKAKLVPKSVRDNFYSQAYGIFSGSGEHEAILRFTGYAAEEVEAQTWHPRELKRRENGAVILQFPYGDSRELIQDILRWGSEVEVLAPLDLRKSVGEHLKQAAAFYK